MALLVSWPPPLTVLTQPQDGGHPGPWLGSTLEPWSLQVGSCLPAGCGEFTSWPGPSQPLCRCRYPPLCQVGKLRLREGRLKVTQVLGGSDWFS